MWKINLVIALFFIMCPMVAISQDTTTKTDFVSPSPDCSEEQFEVAQERFRGRQLRGSPEKLLKALVDGCSDAFWADGAKSYLHTVQEERADTLIKIALYYERLFVTGKSTGNRGAISRYEFILANYPHYSRTDYLLLILGNAYSSAGEWEKGFSTYTRLINEFPTSKYVRNAYKHLD